MFDVVNRVIKDDRVKKQKVRPNFPENPFNQPVSLVANKSMHPNVSWPLFQTASNYFNDSNNNPTDNYRIEKPSRERSPLNDRPSAFGQHSSFMDKPEPHGSLNYQASLSGFHKLNSPSSISSPNQANFSNFFTFHQQQQNQPLPSSHPHHFPENLHQSNFNAFNQTGFNQNHHFNGQNNFSNPKHRPTALTSKQPQTNQATNKAQLPARIWHERPKPSIHTLHPELWTIIFENLNIRDKCRVARTCRFFRDIMYSKSVWKGEVAQLHLRKRHCSPELLECLTRRGIKSVQVSHVFSLFLFEFVRHS